MADPLAALGGLALPAAAPPDPKDRRAATEFEAYMVSFLAQQMRATLPEGPLSSGPMQMFGGLFDQEIGRRVAEAGGFGLADSVEGALASREAPKVKPAHPLADIIGRLTSGFGERTDPIDGTRRAHRGIDIGRAEGSPVRAVDEGVVRFAGRRGGYGNLVIVEHADGTQTRYAHCRDLSVREGEAVVAGYPVGTVGSTGRSTGPHLHFEVRRAGKAVDPEAWLREKGLRLE
jgi:murein DD-endopeptidase MepM/ murein hydrolase activator NlpD